MDDMARWYLSAGVIEDEDDIFDCQKCGFSVMPWQIGCDACGDPNPSQPPKPEMWFCTNCMEEYESIIDAEACCTTSYCFTCDAYTPGYECEECKEVADDF